MPHSSETLALAADGASATIALRGAEPLSWRIGGRELIWHGDPAHWPQRAPILFPVIGASAGGFVRVEGRSYPMPRHGFARDLPFGLVERRPDRARLRLRATGGTLRHYPFCFRLDVIVALAADRLSLRFTVTNADDRPMPYAVGFHPGFPWPFDGGSRERYRLVFERPEDAAVPDVTADGLLRPGLRRAPFAGRVLPLNPDVRGRRARPERRLEPLRALRGSGRLRDRRRAGPLPTPRAVDEAGRAVSLHRALDRRAGHRRFLGRALRPPIDPPSRAWRDGAARRRAAFRGGLTRGRALLDETGEKRRAERQDRVVEAIARIVQGRPRRAGEPDIGARNRLQHVGEVLAAHLGRDPGLDVVAAEELDRRLLGGRGLDVVVVENAEDIADVDLDRGAEGRRDPGRELADAGSGKLAHRPVEGAYRAGKMRRIRDHVVGRAGADLRDRDHHRLQRIGVAADDRLHRLAEGHGDDGGVARLVRVRPVRALALDADIEEIRRCHRGAGPHRDLAARPVRPVVETVNLVAGEALEEPVGEHS